MFYNRVHFKGGRQCSTMGVFSLGSPLRAETMFYIGIPFKGIDNVPQWAETHILMILVMWCGKGQLCSQPNHPTGGGHKAPARSTRNAIPLAGGGTGLILQSIQSGLGTPLLPLMHFNGSAFAHRLGGEHKWYNHVAKGYRLHKMLQTLLILSVQHNH